ncbi:MAG: metallophosphoesterase family protein [Acidobacteriaceae bacterium]|nr:metallophosphoesterase family protein [Acidobacteriaceae bacterium]
MQFLILSDLHANWHALKAVLADAKDKYEQIICCGDLVGYNPHPARVLAWTREHCATVIRGNHDKVVAGIEDLEWFNDVAQAAARWTIDNLNAEELGYLRDLEKGPLRLEHFHICHGSPRDEDEYVTTTREAAPCFGYFELPLAFFGHTHVQGGFVLRHGRVSTIAAVPKEKADSVLELDPDGVYMINPGAVGQPRDGDPRAAYAIYDSGQKLVFLKRVRYPVKKTAEEIKTAGLPDVLAFRLSRGF